MVSTPPAMLTICRSRMLALCSNRPVSLSKIPRWMWLRHGLATNAVSRQRRSTMRNETNNVPAPRDQSGGYNLATGRGVAIVARSAANIRQVSIRRPIA